MQNRDKVALFDFCETIANFQTADGFVNYVREKLNDKRMYRLERMQNCLRKLKIIQIIEIVTRYRLSINKRMKLWQLRSYSFEVLQGLARDYYQEKIKPNFIHEIIGKMMDLKAKGYIIMLVSGGYDIYLKFFAEEYALAEVISTKIDFKGGICTGKFDGIDCVREGKIIVLNKYFKSKPQFSVAFSDSKSDIPFLKWVDVGYVISRNQHQSWSSENKLKEIIWIERRK